MTQHSPGAEETPIPKSIRHLLDQPINVKLHLLQHHAQMARLLAGEILEEEVESLAGERYSRDKPHDGRYSRWGTNSGSIRIDGERMPIDVPRVRDTEACEERPDESERGPGWTDEKVVDALSCGIATVARLRRRFTTEGLEACLRVIADRPGRPPKIDRVAEAHLVALACLAPPKGRARWSIRLLADQFVELGLEESWLGEPGDGAPHAQKNKLRPHRVK